MATSVDQRKYVKTALRLPPELHAAVHEAAQKSGRSYNAELVALIQRALAVPEGFIAAPRSLMSITQDGDYSVRDGREAMIELASLLEKASNLAQIFRSFQEGMSDAHVGEPPPEHQYWAKVELSDLKPPAKAKPRKAQKR